MQRPKHDRALVPTLLVLTLAGVLGCKSEGDAGKDGKEDKTAQADAPAADSGDKAPTSAGPTDAPDSTAPPTVVAPEDPANAGDTTGPGDGAATGTTGGDAAPAEDPIPGWLEQAKNLETEDTAAIAALDSAKAAGAPKLDLAKLANTRGEQLVAKSEGERAEPFFIWARDNHTTFAEPSFNLAKQAALAGDVEVAKEHLLEVQKRGNKKLLKKIGVDPVFTILLDDPEIQKMYEQ